MYAPTYICPTLIHFLGMHEKLSTLTRYSSALICLFVLRDKIVVYLFMYD